MFHFFAFIDRMRYIRRWGLMRSTIPETLTEHAHQTAMIAHALVLIENRQFGADLNPDRAAVLALYHDASETITGDLPTPIKYYNQGIHGAYKELEKHACEKLVATLPEEMQGAIAPYVLADEASVEYKLVKAADRLAAYVKCLEELRSGNSEFSKAKKSIEEDLHARNMPEVEYFFEHFIPSYQLTLDELEAF